MHSFQDVIASWPSIADLAADLSTPAAKLEPNTVKQWKTRDKIPDEHWLAVAEAAKRRGLKRITVEKLAALSAAKRAA